MVRCFDSLCAIIIRSRGPLLNVQMITDRLYRALRPCAALRRLSTRVVRRLPHRQRLVRHFGQRLLVDPSELTGFYLYYEQEYDDGIFRFLSKRLSSFAWAIDLGANIGVYTTFIARYCDSVDAFEPDKHLVSKFERNLHLNGISNVTIHAKCISDVTGMVRFEASSTRNLGEGKIAERGISLPSVSLGDFLAKSVRRSLFIKMDIEGAEWLAIKGLKTHCGPGTAVCRSSWSFIRTTSDDTAVPWRNCGTYSSRLAWPSGLWTRTSFFP